MILIEASGEKEREADSLGDRRCNQGRESSTVAAVTLESESHREREREREQRFIADRIARRD